MNNILLKFKVSSICNISNNFICSLVTNLNISLVTNTIFMVLLIFFVTRKIYILPTREQIIGDFFLKKVNKNTINILRYNHNVFSSVIFTIFYFILINNIAGVVPLFFPVTSSFFITMTISAISYIIILSSGFYLCGIRYFNILLPSSIPYFLTPLILLIEITVNLLRPFNMSVRLAVNIIAGHIVCEVFCFIVRAMSYLGIIPFIILTVVNMFEIITCILQAYIFVILTCTYLSESLEYSKNERVKK